MLNYRTHALTTRKRRQLTSLPRKPLKEPCQTLVQQIEDSLRESSKVANKGKNLTENGLDMWKEDRKETFQENYVRKNRGEAEAVISALRGVRNSANKVRYCWSSSLTINQGLAILAP
jgi:hypothetical protein